MKIQNVWLIMTQLPYEDPKIVANNDPIPFENSKCVAIINATSARRIGGFRQHIVSVYHLIFR